MWQIFLLSLIYSSDRKIIFWEERHMEKLFLFCITINFNLILSSKSKSFLFHRKIAKSAIKKPSFMIERRKKILFKIQFPSNCARIFRNKNQLTMEMRFLTINTCIEFIFWSVMGEQSSKDFDLSCM